MYKCMCVMQEDGSGSFTLPKDDVSSASADESTGVAGAEGEVTREIDEVDGQPEDISEESGEDEKERVDEGEEEEIAEDDDDTQQQLEEMPPIEEEIPGDDMKQEKGLCNKLGASQNKLVVLSCCRH